MAKYRVDFKAPFPEFGEDILKQLRENVRNGKEQLVSASVVDESTLEITTYSYSK